MAVDQVTELEKQFGIYDIVNSLRRFLRRNDRSIALCCRDSGRAIAALSGFGIGSLLTPLLALKRRDEGSRGRGLDSALGRDGHSLLEPARQDGPPICSEFGIASAGEDYSGLAGLGASAVPVSSLYSCGPSCRAGSRSEWPSRPSAESRTATRLPSSLRLAPAVE